MTNLRGNPAILFAPHEDCWYTESRVALPHHVLIDTFSQVLAYLTQGLGRTGREVDVALLLYPALGHQIGIKNKELQLRTDSLETRVLNTSGAVHGASSRGDKPDGTNQDGRADLRWLFAGVPSSDVRTQRSTDQRHGPHIQLRHEVRKHPCERRRGVLEIDALGSKAVTWKVQSEDAIAQSGQDWQVAPKSIGARPGAVKADDDLRATSTLDHPS